MSELSVGALSGLAANSYVIDVASGSTLDVTNATGTLPSAQLPAGSILQVVSAVKTNQFTTSSTGWVDVPSLNATITPSSSSNKILVLVHIGLQGNTGSAHMNFFTLFRNDTNQMTAPDCISGAYQNNSGTGVALSFALYDSPASTTAKEYSVGMRVNGSTGVLNRIAVNNLTTSESTITLMEVAG